MTRRPPTCLPVAILVFVGLTALPLFSLSSVAAPLAAESGAGAIEGRVVDQTGAPLVAAIVLLVPHSAPAPRRTATTESDGSFRFAGVAAGDYDLVASAPLFSAAQQTVQVGSEPISVAIVLMPGALSEDLTVYGTRVGDSPATLQRLPGALAVVDQHTLAGSEVFSVNEALRKVPGVNVREEEGLGLRPNIGLRGLNPTRSTKVLLLEDGVPFTMAPYGDNASYYHPPIERFERVEVLKGSGQIAYGPATVGGIVNYVTPEVPAQAAGLARLALGSHDYVNGTGTFGATRGRVGFLVDAMLKEGDGARENIHSTVGDVTGKLLFTLTNDHSLTAKASYYGERSDITYSGLTEAEYAANPRQNPFVNDAFAADRVGLTATWRARFGEGWLMTANLYGSSFGRDWWRQSSNSAQRPNDRSDPACGGMANLNTTCGNEGRLREYTVWGLEPRFRATPVWLGIQSETDFGVRYHAERQDREQQNGATPTATEGAVVEDNLRENRAVSAFVQNRFLLGPVTLTPGVRVEAIRYDRLNRLGNGGAGVSGTTRLTQWIPGVGATYAASPRLTVFTGIHRGFAPPRTEDVIGNITGSVVDLDPELSWDTEVGARFLPAAGASVDATFFRMNYENQIVPASLAGGVGSTLTNGGQTLHQGLEIAGRVDSAGFVATRHNVFARAAYTYLGTAEFTGTRFSNVAGFSSVSVTGNRLPYAPQHLLTLTGGYQHQAGVDAQVEYVYVSDQFGDDLNSIAPSPDGQRGLIPGHGLWNVAASWTIPRLSGALFVTVKNLTDHLYIADRARGVIPGMPRLVQVGFRVRFD